MAHILTLQSHVVYGYAGNAAAVFPMQRLGHEVSVLNLLQFSNHTGHGSHAGGVISVDELKSVFSGLKQVGALENVAGIISGYMGELDQAQAIHDFILEVKTANPQVIYCCDPVMGDERPGMYVKPEVAKFIRSHLVPIANWIMPNRFELSQLVNRNITNMTETIAACYELFDQQKQGILATSAVSQPSMTGLLLVTKENVYHCETPQYELIHTVHGTGDVTTAVFLSHILHNDQPKIALEKTANTLHDIVQFTFENNLPELAVIRCQEAIAHPTQTFKAKRLEVV